MHSQWNLLDHLVWSLGLKGLVVPKGPGTCIMYGTAAKLLFPEWRKRYVDRIEKCPYTWGQRGSYIDTLDSGIYHTGT